MRPADALDPDRIRRDLPTAWLGRRVLVYASTSSTNDVAAAYAARRDSHGLVVVGEHQRAGRGRGGHHWTAAPGQSLLVSVVLIDSPLSAARLSLAVPVAVAEALGPEAGIKWPNDVLLQGRKVCGILIEHRALPAHHAAILGVGINCLQQRDDFPEGLRETAISLAMTRDGVVDRLSLLRRLLVSLETTLDAVRRDPEAVVARWRSRSHLTGQWVTLAHDGRCYRGCCLGVDPDAGLIVQLERGGIRHFPAAQTHRVEAVSPPP